MQGIESWRIFPPSFGIPTFRSRRGRYLRCTSSSRSCSRNLSKPSASIAWNVTPSPPGAPLFSLASCYASQRVSRLQTWTYNPQKSPSRFSLRLRSCSLKGAFIISPLPPVLAKTCCAARPLRSMGVTPLLRYSEPNRHRLAVSRFPVVSGYTAYPAPPNARWGEDGFSSCLTYPCHRAAPTTPPEWPVASVSPRPAMLPSPERGGLGLRS